MQTSEMSEEPPTESELQTESEPPTESELSSSLLTSEPISVASVEVESVASLEVESVQSENNQPEYVADEASATDTEEPDVVFVGEFEEQRGSKREHEDEDTSESNKKKRIESDEDDDGNLCPICFDIWNNSGTHRVCCLRCGHLFGHSCLLRWINTQTGNKKSCPTCKRKVIKSDIRFIYVKKLIAADTSEIESLRKQLEETKEDKTKLYIELNTLSLQMEQKIHKLQSENDRLKKLTICSSNIQQNKVTVNELRCWMDKSLEISTEGGCRVLDYSPAFRTLAVSLISPNPIFSGYGIRKIMMPNYKPTAFIPVHVKAIRDLSFKDNLLLSVSLDSKAKLINMNTNSEVASFSCTNPLWSCCWDADDPNIFYVGESRGTVSIFDIRNTRESVSVIETEGDGSPVVSLASTRWESGEAMPRGGILCCKLNSCWAFGKTSSSADSFDQKPLPLEGPFMSLRYNHETRHILVSARANQRYQYTRHILCELKQADNMMHCNVVHTYQGAATQSMLSRSCFVNVHDNVYAAAYHASDRNVTLWSVRTGQKAGSVPAHMPILDLCTIETQNANYLTTLNEKKMDFFQIGKTK